MRAACTFSPYFLFGVLAELLKGPSLFVGVGTVGNLFKLKPEGDIVKDIEGGEERVPLENGV